MEYQNHRPINATGVRMLRSMLAGCLLSILLAYPMLASADCSKYLHAAGYCTDYVQRRTGHRQSGDAGTWKTNKRADQGVVGDVIVQNVGSRGHVAVIERILYRPYTAIPAAYEVSEMNYGARTVDGPCAVTDKFGQVTRRIVQVAQIRGIWHP
jgi:surface antigen